MNSIQVATKLGHSIYQYIASNPGVTSLDIAIQFQALNNKSLAQEINQNLARLCMYDNIKQIKGSRFDKVKYYIRESIPCERSEQSSS